jgi:glycerol kinase
VVRALAIDVGSTSIRTALVDTQGLVSCVHRAPLRVSTPAPGEVELDPQEIRDTVFALARKTLDEGGPCDAVGITNQRATTIVFDGATGEAVGPALSWQDLRTVINCLVLQGQGIRLAPNQSATKAQWLVEQSRRHAHELRFATIESWITWHLSQGASHVTDQSNAAITGLVGLDATKWDATTLGALGLDVAMMPRIVPTMGTHVHAYATALEGSPPITALVGDQSASLFGQCCIARGVKITLGTGAMLDVVGAQRPPASTVPLASGCFPIIARSDDETVTWGLEAISMAAGSCLEWLRDSLGLLSEVDESESLATSIATSDGVWFVPAFSGLGTPKWDFGARGAFFGLTLASSKAHLVRAVLEGIAHRCADLLDAVQQESALAIDEIRVDGGMSANSFLVQCVANFTGVRVAVSSEREATTRGVGLMALVARGHLSVDDVERLWHPRENFIPQLSDVERSQLRTTWLAMVERVERTIPELSTVKF